MLVEPESPRTEGFTSPLKDVLKYFPLSRVESGANGMNKKLPLHQWVSYTVDGQDHWWSWPEQGDACQGSPHWLQRWHILLLLWSALHINRQRGMPITMGTQSLLTGNSTKCGWLLPILMMCVLFVGGTHFMDHCYSSKCPQLYSPRYMQLCIK